eukprot:12931004-Prorocentrum_lima.AAC.1
MRISTKAPAMLCHEVQELLSCRATWAREATTARKLEHQNRPRKWCKRAQMRANLAFWTHTDLDPQHVTPRRNAH